MSLAVAQAFAPTYQALPSYLKRSAVAISPRFPRDGVMAAGPASGTTGLVGTITPVRSAIEAGNWGASLALWSYTDQAASLGYASPAAFVTEMTAAGVRTQGTTNTRAANSSTGPFMQDAGGSDWSAGSNPNRPALNAGQPSPLASRISISIDYMPANDPTNTQTPKLATMAMQMAAGCFGLHMDDPRSQAAYSGWRGIASTYDITSQGCDFSATARAGFTTWLGANTSTSDRTAVGLPASLAGFDILTWLKANKASIMFSANQVDSTAVDNYLFRTSISNDSALRTILLTWMNKFLRADHAGYVGQVRTQLAGAPLSLNYFQASPCEFMSWQARQASQLWDFAVAETSPPYWADISGFTVGSASWLTARESQCARQHLNAVTCDLSGLRAYFEHKPTALNAAPARVVTQLLRQSIMQSLMEGSTPVVPIDCFMTVNDDKDQGVNVDGYRFWGSTANFGNCFSFLAANAAVIDGYEKCATVFVAVHDDAFPFYSGTQGPRFYTLMDRLAELWRRDVDYHLLPVGSADGLMPLDPLRSVETAAPLIIRLQDDADYYTHLGRLAGTRCRKWSAAAADEAVGHSPARSTNPNVRVVARYNASARRVSLHVHNYGMNSDGTPAPQTVTLLWNWEPPKSIASVTRLGEGSRTATFVNGAVQISLTEYAIVNFAV